MSEVFSVGELIERLIIEVVKVSVLENRKAEEQKQNKPNSELITKWDKASRSANEMKVKIKNELDKKLKEIIEEGKYNFTEIGRTF